MQIDIPTSAEQLGIGQRLMLAAGLLAAGGFAFVSIAANLRFGVSLASTPFDRIIYGTLSIAADLMKTPFRSWSLFCGGRVNGYSRLPARFSGSVS